jgi:hypothetical protein
MRGLRTFTEQIKGGTPSVNAEELSFFEKIFKKEMRSNEKSFHNDGPGGRYDCGV